MKFSIKDFFGKCDQIRRKLAFWHFVVVVLYTPDSNFWKKRFFGSKNIFLSKNYQKAKFKPFESQICDLNQICNIVFTQND